jgi:hypothetical protein
MLSQKAALYNDNVFMVSVGGLKSYKLRLKNTTGCLWKMALEVHCLLAKDIWW